ncbi:MAG: Ig-like domain-containing protein, partial [Chloroflexota bacterium]
MGTAGGRLDSGSPVIAGQVTGTAGEAGWYVSEVTVTASASDAVSGLVSFDVSIDGSGWAPYGGAISLADGEHTVELRASDAAGNVATESLEVRVDTQPPDLNLAVGGSFCPGCGESADITLDVQDGGSGVAAWNLTAEGNAIASGTGLTSETLAWDGSGLGAGTHTLTLSADDAAGNAADMTVSVQLVAPTAVPTTNTPSRPQSQDLALGRGPTATSRPSVAPTRTSVPTRTPSTSSFGGVPAVPMGAVGDGPEGPQPEPQTETAAAPQGPSSGVLWAGAAVALIGAATTAALEAARRRKEEEARQKEEMRRRNAEAERREEEARRQAGLARLAALAAAAVEAGRRALDQRRTQRLEEAEGEVSRRTGGPSVPTATPPEGNAVTARSTPLAGVAGEAGGEDWRSEFARWRAQLQARAISRLGGALRGFGQAEERAGLISGMVAAAGEAL